MEAQSPLPTLQVITNAKPAMVPSDKTIWHVDMSKWAFLKAADSLGTNGSGPCLIVVVHNSTENIGCLSHIPHSTQKQSVLYDEACQTILKMIDRCTENNKRRNFAVWLGSGYAFFPGNIYTPLLPVAQDFPVYLNLYLNQQTCLNYRILDNRTQDPNDPGAAIYYPYMGCVLSLQRKDQTIIDQISRGPVPGTFSSGVWLYDTVKRPDR